MQKLVQGIHHFQDHIFHSKKELFERLSGGQTPDALFITCSDSRINPNLITQTEPGELFIMRNAGNIIPPYGAANGGEAATIEFAVQGLGIKDIIVCGHSHCGAIKGLMKPDSLSDMPMVRQWLGHAEATRCIIEENYADYRYEDKLNIAVQENVLVQLEHLRTLPVVAARLMRGELNLHGWVYKFETGEVFSYEPGRGQFTKFIAENVNRPADRTRQSGVSSI